MKTLKEQGRWSRKYKKCKNRKCETPEAQHRQEGLCTICWSKRRYKEEKSKFKKYHKDYYEKNKDELKKKMKNYYKGNKKNENKK